MKRDTPWVVSTDPPCVMKRDGGVTKRDTINKFGYMKNNVYVCNVKTNMSGRIRTRFVNVL